MIPFIEQLGIDDLAAVRETMNGGVTLVLSSSMVVVLLLLVIAGDVELNPGPGGRYT